jgi:hypothetical protein
MILALTLALAFTFGCTQQSSQNQQPAAPATDAGQTANQSPAAAPEPAPAGGGMAEKKPMNKPESKAPAKEATPAAPAPPPPLVVTAGTGLTIRLGNAVGSKISQTGDAFTGTIAQDISVGDKVAIPSGSAVSGSVTDAKPLGRFAGGASLALTLHSVTVNGKSYNITTSAFAEAAKGKGKRTGIMAGGGAAVGAIIGGIAGGGKGAAIGALAGGGAGTAGAAFTGNKDIVLPAEKLLTFKLAGDLTIKQ